MIEKSFVVTSIDDARYEVWVLLNVCFATCFNLLLTLRQFGGRENEHWLFLELFSQITILFEINGINPRIFFQNCRSKKQNTD